MAMGRKIKPVSEITGNRTKEEIKIRKEVEEEVKENINIFSKTPPNHYRKQEGEEDNVLDELVRREWNRIYPELEKLPISKLDRTSLESYCVMYAMFRVLYEKVKEQGVLVQNSRGETVPNPIIKEMKSITSELKSIAPLLGMSVDSRMKLAMQNKELEKDEEKGENIMSLFDRK